MFPSIIPKETEDMLQYKVTGNVEKVPEHIYQIMYDMATVIYDEDERKAKIRQYLIDYYRNTRPGQVIINMIDLSGYEANLIRAKYPQHHDIEWGMYVVLAEGTYDTSNLIT